MKKFLVFALLTAGCSSTPVAPTEAAKLAPIELSYSINIPVLADELRLAQTYPNGVRMAPVAAQNRWDYTAVYKGSPNVYYGETAPWIGYDCSGKVNGIQQYMMTGIVVAPYYLAAQDQFVANSWPPGSAGQTVVWVGRFTYSSVSTLTFTPCS